MSTSNELDRLFAEFQPRKPVVKKAAPISPLAKLQASLDALTGTGANRCDLSKVDARSPVRRKVMVVKATEARDWVFHNQTGDESLGTRTARQSGGNSGIAKAESQVDVAPGFSSMSRLTGKY